jgi:hypothetical protein
MREVGAFEAKNKLGQLLDWVEAGVGGRNYAAGPNSRTASAATPRY